MTSKQVNQHGLEMDRKISILIIDDHPMLREGLKAIMKRDKNLEVVGEAGRADKGIALAKELMPDIALVDISLPDRNGTELIREMSSSLPDTKLIVISMHSGVEYIVSSFQAGALGYITKESAWATLLKGINLVLKGEYFLDSSLSQQVVKRLMEMPAREKRITDASYNSLTNREQEIMRMLAEGIPKKKIAERLFISVKTVENHCTNIMNKLNLHSLIDIVRYAARLGLIDVDLWKG